MIELDITITDLSKELATLKDTVTLQDADICKKSKDLDRLTEALNSTTAANEGLQTEIVSDKKTLQEVQDHARALELQLETYNDKDHTMWTDVVAEVVKVKGAANPMSNFYPCNIPAFGQNFDSVEHSYHWKHAMDRNLFDEAATIKSQSTAKLAKAKADEFITKSNATAWEESNLSIMRYLLRVKRQNCSEFVSHLQATGNRTIMHNVASDFWGTGTDGKGKNTFGQLLTELRDELPTSASTTSSQPSAATTSPAAVSTAPAPPPQPEVLLLGNSLLSHVRPDKVSRDFSTTLKTAYSIKEAKEAIDQLEDKPAAIALQLTTNDIKGEQPVTATVQEYSQLVAAIQDKLPSCKILTSQAPNKTSTSRLSTRTALANASIEDMYRATDIVCIDNSNITSFSEDNIHLTRYGTSTLVRNVKAAIAKCLSITPTATRRTPAPQPPSRARQPSQSQGGHPSVKSDNLQSQGQGRRRHPQTQGRYHGSYNAQQTSNYSHHGYQQRQHRGREHPQSQEYYHHEDHYYQLL